MKDARALFAAARRDAPTGNARSAMWTAVALRTSLATSTTAASPGAPPAASSASGPVTAWKAGLVGGLAGGALVLGATLALGTLPLPPPSAPTSSVPAAAATWATASPAPGLAPTADQPASAALAAEAMAPPHADGRRGPGPAARAPRAGDDLLTREAALLEAARAALRRGDAGDALAKLAKARALPVRQLEPEARSLEARARAALSPLGTEPGR